MRTEPLEIETHPRPSMPTSRDIVAVLFRQRSPMLIVFFVVVIVVILSREWVPKYDAHMKILVQRQRSDAMITSSPNAPAQFTGDQVSEEDLNSEVALLNSEDLLRKVVLTTGLSAKGGSPDGRKDEVTVARAVRLLARDLKIESLRKSNVISVQYSNHDPQMAAHVLQALSAAYTEKHLDLHRASGELKFFDQQTQRYQQGLDQAQAKLTDFTKTTGVVSAQLERDSALREANDFDATAHQAQATIVETQQRVRALQGQLQSMQPRMTTVIRTSDNPQLLQHLKSTLLDLELKKTDLLTKYEPTYRLVQEIDQQIADAKSAITAEERNPIKDETTDQNPDYEWVRAELTKAQTDLTGLRAREAAASAVAAQYHATAEHLEQDELTQEDLLQTAKTQEENYLLYERKREEARINDALDQRGILNVALVEEPVVPALSSRSPLSFALLALVLAGTLSLTTAFVVDLMDPSFRTPDELSNYLGVPVLAALPKGEQ